jgi:hydroxypyruvate isomerase
LDEAQEINYPAVVRKLLAVKYAGHVGHEFIPTRNPREGLAQAVKVCDA